jgi:drug/metabolite transporter (DMT)-like permease
MDLRAVVLSLFVAFLWALNIIIQKYQINQSINPKTVVVIGAITYATCMLFFFIYHYHIIATDIKKTNINHIALIAFGAIVGTFLGSMLFVHLLEKHNSSLVTALAYTTPVFVLLLAFFILKEKLDRVKILGIFLTVIGIMLICYKYPPTDARPSGVA